MAAHNRYHVIEAETLDARKRHRALIEKALREGDLSPQMRDELMRELKQAVIKESTAQKAFDDGEEEERKEKTEGGDGKQGSSGGGGGFGRGDETTDDASEEDGLSDIEVFELLLFLAEHDTSQSYTTDITLTTSADAALGAATLLYDPQEQIALIGEPYALEPDGTPHAPSTFLPSLEYHAANLGAHTLHVNVHPDAVALFRTFGYEIQKKSMGRKNISVTQTMRKTLIIPIKPPPGTDYV